MGWVRSSTPRRADEACQTGCTCRSSSLHCRSHPDRRQGVVVRRWAQFVLHHRRLVIVFWLFVIVAGAAAAGKVSNRLTVDFSLPGQPGTQAAHKIKALLGNGGDTN